MIAVSSEQLEIILSILNRHVPTYVVWAFGSRATGKAKEYSDLDLAIISDQPLSLSILASLDEDFDNSDLPFKVDVVDWATSSDEFKSIIKQQKVILKKS